MLCLVVFRAARRVTQRHPPQRSGAPVFSASWLRVCMSGVAFWSWCRWGRVVSLAWRNGGSVLLSCVPLSPPCSGYFEGRLQHCGLGLELGPQRYQVRTSGSWSWFSRLSASPLTRCFESLRRQVHRSSSAIPVLSVSRHTRDCGPVDGSVGAVLYGLGLMGGVLDFAIPVLWVLGC